jgi:hypothetical protein
LAQRSVTIEIPASLADIPRLFVAMTIVPAAVGGISAQPQKEI